MIIPKKLKSGDGVRVISPARSLAMVSQESRKIANKRFKDLGLKLSFSKNAEEKDRFLSKQALLCHINYKRLKKSYVEKVLIYWIVL